MALAEDGASSCERVEVGVDVDADDVCEAAADDDEIEDILLRSHNHRHNLHNRLSRCKSHLEWAVRSDGPHALGQRRSGG